MSAPAILPVGLSGLLVRFADGFSEPANRAALAFRAALEGRALPGVAETAPSLVSVFLRIDALAADRAALTREIAALLDSRDWYGAPLPEGRRRWTIPTAYGGEIAPGLAASAEAAGLSQADAIAELSAATVRVLTLGFAPGQPYLGTLPERWNLPRQTDLTPRVPAGALVLAIRQFVLFAAPSPTGWRHVGQTGFRVFRPGTETPFPLNPGDELRFAATDRDHVERLVSDGAPDGGAEVEEI